MSNSIWKKPTVRPVKNCIVVWQNPAHMSFTLPRTARKYMERYNCERWATLDDLIAQADKAERLLKAMDLIANMEQRLCIDAPVDILDDVLKIAKDEIKQLIKGGQYK